MKKNLFLAAFAVVAMASCSKSEIADPSASASAESSIGFTTFIDRVTKGSEGTQTTLQTDGFGVICFETDATSGDWNGSSVSPTVIMGNTTDNKTPQAVKYENGAWTYGDLQYWKDGGKLSIFAYSPAFSDMSSLTAPTALTDIVADFATTTAYPNLTFTTNSTLTSQVDLLVYSELNMTDDGNPINFNFEHALSKIGFTVDLADNMASGYYVKVTDVEIYIDDKDDAATTQKTTATLDADGVYTFADAAANAAWAETSTPTALGIATVSIYDATVASGSTATNASDETKLDTTNSPVDITGADKYLMIVPQALDAGDIIEVTVSYDIYDDQDAKQNTSGTLTKSVFVPVITYAKGTAYTYNIKVGKNAIVFDSAIGVSAWAIGETAGTGSGNLDLE